MRKIARVSPVFFFALKRTHVPFEAVRNRAGISAVSNYVLTTTKGMGEIFHGQTKGYMFVCDQFHIFIISNHVEF
ncbi:hypothetical protein DI291_06875 [Bacillus paralicheniformis]|nr:hypothetical protein DI291_06875 [Bacillus paralicheniformis]